jgi:predicted RNA binding protein YcfA (HicA-like mRNA interferase family)
MAKKEKLLEKLRNGSITPNDLRTLLIQSGFTKNRTRGSHEQWYRGTDRFSLATHGKTLKPYELKKAVYFLKGE